jgi:hypothetical protein
MNRTEIEIVRYRRITVLQDSNPQLAPPVPAKCFDLDVTAGGAEKTCSQIRIRPNQAIAPMRRLIHPIKRLFKPLFRR